MIHELVIQRGPQVFEDLKIVVGFKNLLWSVAQRSVARENACASRSKKSLMNVRNPVDYAGQTVSVVWPVPGFAFHADAQRRGAIHVRERPRLICAIAPSQARENANVLSEFLFDVKPETAFVAVSARRFDVGGPRRA